MRAIIFFILLFVVGVFACKPPHERDRLFELLPASHTGVAFSNTLTETNQMNVLEYQDFYSGGGVSVGDIDNDGLSDIFFTGNQVDAKLYKNLGDMRFQDITEAAGLGRMGRGWYTGTSMADVNADGYLDIYISKSGMEAPDDRANLLFINQGDGTFLEQAEAFGLDHRGFAVNASFFDYDRDGDLDMYLVNQGPIKLKSGNARQLRHERHPEAGDVLFENIEGRFVDVTMKADLYSSVIGFAHGVSIGDVNEDGWEDIFVSNDFFEYDYLYINNQDKTFREVIKSATNHISYYSMGNDMADYNNDGLLDIMVLDMIAEGNRRLHSNLGGMNTLKFLNHLENGLHHQYMSNMLHLNNGNTTFSEVGKLAGISNTDWSWAPIFADFDNDGWKDLYVTNGIRKDVRNIDWGKYYFDVLGLSGGEHNFGDRQWKSLLERMPAEPVENYMFRNKGDLTFEKAMEIWGMEEKSWSNGVAYGDLDNDGDLDLVVNNIDQEAFIYRNNQQDHNFIRFAFQGPARNPYALGTKVKIYSDSVMQYQQHYLTRGYRSSMEPVMHFGLGKDTVVSKVEVIWPDGKASFLFDQPANQMVTLDYMDAVDTVFSFRKSKNMIFQNIEIGEYIRHEENEMEDFLRSPALPYKLSALGPALAVGDVNGDGLDDFFLGGSFRRAGQILLQSSAGQFSPSNMELLEEERMFEDVGAVFFDLENDGDLDLYIVSGGSEHSAETGMLNDRLYLNDGIGNFVRHEVGLPEVNCSGSVVLPADYDQDGDMDLFVGGRQIPGKYMMPASSYLLENQGGILRDVTKNNAEGLLDLGMVTDGVWVDTDQDGDEDLVVVGEWMPVVVFQNNNGKFSKQESKANGLDQSHGWWWSIAAGDIDKDGDMDLIAGNMGLNYMFRASEEAPLVAFVADFDDNQQFDFVMGYHQNGVLYPTVDRGYAITQLNFLAEKVMQSDQYSVMSLEEIYGPEKLQQAQRNTIKNLHSCYIENLGNGVFLMKALPNYAQMSNVNSIIVRDVDDDGHLDLILAGNLHVTEARIIRNDASRGIWMKGDGKGNFIPVHFLDCGLDLTGDVRNTEIINLGGHDHIIAAKNNDDVQLVRLP